jgi:hypothetical protein
MQEFVVPRSIPIILPMPNIKHSGCQQSYLFLSH